MAKYNLIIITALLFSFSCSSQSKKKNNEFDEFRSKFLVATLPYNSSHLNKNSTYISLASKANKLNRDLCAKYFFNDDLSKIKYRYENFNMEEGRSLGMVEEEYNFYPAFRIENKDITLLGYLRTSVDTYEYFVAAFEAKQFKVMDVLQINRVDDEFEVELIEASFITEDLNVHVFKYTVNPEYRKAQKTKNEKVDDKTLITYTIYQVDKIKKKFELLKSETSTSKCSVSDFQQHKTECADGDPFQELLK